MKDKKLRYIAYVRKSSESKEKQELSHISQIDNIKAQFGNLNIVKWMPAESKSAFTPGRPIFRDLMDAIQNGEADAIVAWHPNRLSRNEIDSAEITYMLRGPLKDLKFCSYNFDPSPEGVMMLQMTMNQSQYESTKQGKDVKRGLATKASTGEKPGRVPPGYKKIAKVDAFGQVIISPKDKKIVTETGKDDERFDDVSQMFKMLLSGSYTPSQVWKFACEEMKFTMPKTPKTGGKLIGKSELYRIFKNPFYAGYFEHNGTLHKITSKSYEQIIDWEEYKTVQQILGERGNHRIGNFEYAFSSMIRCGVCNCLVQARHRTKFVKSENCYKTYVYYYCSRKSMDRPCNQTKYTILEDIEANIDEELGKYTIIPEFKDLALKVLRKNNKLESKERSRMYDKHLSKRSELQNSRDRLIDDLHRELISEEEYLHHKNRLQVEIENCDELLRNTEKRAGDWMELNEKAFNFAVHAQARFRSGDVRTKREILTTLGKDLVLQDNKLHIEPENWLVPIAEKYPEIERSFLKVRTNKNATSKEIEAALVPIYSNWRAQRGSNPRHAA